MSEGDAVHRVALRLHEALAGRPLVDARSPSPRAALGAAAQRLRGSILERAEARGKHLLLHFDRDLVVHSHLGMSGSWQLYPQGERWRRPQRAAWLVLTTDDIDAVEFGGPRLSLSSAAELRRDRRLAALGPDLLGVSFAPDAALARLRRADPTRSLGDALLDQTLLAGIGNVYKSEACFEARLDPRRALRDLSDVELLLAISTARDQMLAGLSSGRMPRRVYRRAGEPCPRCRTPIVTRGQGDANRLSYWCPTCQG